MSRHHPDTQYTETMHDALDGLNPAQREAAEHDSGPLMVLAGPGTGKTRVIAHRIAHMVQGRGIAPESIAAVTYTVKAARQLRERLHNLIGPDAENVHAHTFHSLGLRILRRFADEAGVRIARMDDGRGGIIDSAQSTRLLRSIVMEHGLFKHARAEGLDAVVGQVQGYMGVLADAGISWDEARAFAAEARGRLEKGLGHAGKPLDAEALAAERERVRSVDEAAEAIALFEAGCRERGWLTFGDLICLPMRILKKSGRAAAILRDEWRHLVVDEFQDVNAAQIELLRLLAPPGAKGSGSAGGGPDLCVVGDDDQSIYEFRGADDRAFQRFSETWPGHATVRLSENYRSGATIVRVANAIIGRATTRYAPDKKIEARLGEPGHPVECIQLEDDAQDGEVIAAMLLTDRAERKDAKWSDYAVVVRSHADGDRVRNALQIEGIPSVAAREGTPGDDEGVKDVLAWVELLASPHAAHAAARVLMRPPFSIDLRAFHPMLSRYRGELTRFEAREPGTPDPGGFADWLARTMPEDPAVARFAALHSELRRLAGEANASEVIFRIITGAEAAHADLLSPRERAERVSNLVGVLKFARERQGRLEQPGDVRAFWSYYQDLSGDEQKMRDAALGSRVDGIGESADGETPDAVRLLTAHSAKGLEFDTVFVPRVSPNHGYGKVGESDGPELPEGLIRRGDDRTARERAAAEARRIFYVACTRAERRLVLLAKKNKSRSKSTHYFEEIVFDKDPKNAVRVIEGADVLKRAGALGLGQGYGWSRPGADGLDGQARGFKAVEQRREVFEQARREVRTAAAGALDKASGGDAAATREAGDLLRAAALRLGTLAQAESSGKVPAWADADARGFAQQVLEKAGRDPKAGSSPEPGGAPGMTPPLRLSFTRVRDYLTCPRCFYLRYVLGLEDLPGPAQVVGLAVHEALEKFYGQQRERESEGGAPPTRASLIELGRAAFFRLWPRHLETDRAQLDQVQAQLGIAFDRLHDPASNVVEVEKQVQFPYGPHTFSCKIDRIDRYTDADGREAFRIVDYKTGGSSKSLREPAGDDLQLGIYALALAHLYGAEAGEALPGVAEYWLLATGVRGSIALGSINQEKVREEIDEAVAGMLAGRWEQSSRCRGGCEILGPLGAKPASVGTPG